MSSRPSASPVPTACIQILSTGLFSHWSFRLTARWSLSARSLSARSLGCDKQRLEDRQRPLPIVVGNVSRLWETAPLRKPWCYQAEEKTVMFFE
jgi:hypothetical protein